ncbi:hypothetical protein FA15DRAFT_594265 [Coprinopsis marcescibilis]|uniref:RlpA-like protein double-psi beta-barrel domain-containing protein n=1 Tax=Coprinopsis marcescibilis TaxID=230819 RepID=A0A5C3KSH8_COPMA|nr:hypothetical protein FA15DRAFT_594265 [Coprinopsis marcescibilis]
MPGIISYLLALAMALSATIGSAYGHPIAANGLEKRVTRVGRATYFYVGLGNCGKYSKDSEPVVAMSKALYDRNKGGNCGQWVEIVDTKTGRKAYGQVWDSCVGCKENELDLSPSLFQKFAPLGQGVLTVSWHFMDKNWKP